MRYIKCFFLTVLNLLLSLLLYCQTSINKADKIKFQSNLQAGAVIGQSDSKSAFTASSINGFKAKQWFAGIGVGVDFYGQKRSVPLFIAVQNALSSKLNAIFIYGNVGYNFAWLEEQQKAHPVNNYRQTGGLFYEAGLGYKFKITRKNSVGLSAGFSFKQVKEKYSTPYNCNFCENYEPPPQIDTYKFSNIAIKLNWWFL